MFIKPSTLVKMSEEFTTTHIIYKTHIHKKYMKLICTQNELPMAYNNLLSSKMQSCTHSSNLSIIISTLPNTRCSLLFD